MRYERLKSDKRFEDCPKCAKKWLINVSEEQDTRNTTVETGTSWKKILIQFQFVPCVPKY